MLKGKVAVVTGSTSGIGLGIATRACRRGLPMSMINGFGEAAAIEKLRKELAERAHGVRVAYSARPIISKPAANPRRG